MTRELVLVPVPHSSAVFDALLPLLAAAVVAAHVLTPVQSYFASIHSKRQMKLPPLQLEVFKASQVRPSHVIVIHSIPNADPAAAAAAAAAASNPNQTSLRRREL